MALITKAIQYRKRGQFLSAVKYKLGIRRSLRSAPYHNAFGWSERRINRLIVEKTRPVCYLEIGVDKGFTFENVMAESRVGVDPHPKFKTTRLPQGLEFFTTTSDEFFNQHVDDRLFDAIFVDGLHTSEQTYRDVVNSFMHLAEDGFLLVDDTVPSDSISAIPDLHESTRMRIETGDKSQNWHGDVFRVVWIISRNFPDIEFRTIVDRDNPQTLMWWNNATPGNLVFRTDLLAESQSLTYDTCFSAAVPSWMNPATEEQVIETYLQLGRGVSRQ